MLEIPNLIESVTKEILNKEDLANFAKQVEKRLNEMDNREGEQYTIDRFEDNIAVCENRNSKRMININKDNLPNNAKEGSILKYTNGKFLIDENLQNETEQRIKEKMDTLWS